MFNEHAGGYFGTSGLIFNFVVQIEKVTSYFDFFIITTLLKISLGVTTRRLMYDIRMLPVGLTFFNNTFHSENIEKNC